MSTSCRSNATSAVLTDDGGASASRSRAELEPVRGPIALGFGCHFGLGIFRRLEK